MKFRVVCVAFLVSISMFARADLLDEFEYALIAGNYIKARVILSEMTDAASAPHVPGYQELLRVFESCEAFIALADEHMIMPSSTPIEKLEAAYDAIGFRESHFAVSDAILDLLNERLQRARQMMEFAHHALSPDSVNTVAIESEAQAAQEQELRAACGLDYQQLKLGMTIDRARMCVGTPYFVSVSNRRGELISIYQIGQRYVHVMGELIIGWVK
jgi:hypothetical protein